MHVIRAAWNRIYLPIYRVLSATPYGETAAHRELRRLARYP